MEKGKYEKADERAKKNTGEKKKQKKKKNFKAKNKEKVMAIGRERKCYGDEKQESGEE